MISELQLNFHNLFISFFTTVEGVNPEVAE
jgi:hypothetical protein